MFTGLVTAVGRIDEVTSRDGGRDLVIAAPWDDLGDGESIAVDGACLTVTSHAPGRFAVHVVTTSLERTTFGAAAPGRRVNLERALRLGDRLGGHMVQGHVDGVGTVLAARDVQDARLIEVSLPEAVAGVTVSLGSITVAGVSLTVDALPRDGVVQLSIIPFTLEHTTLGELRPGDQVHLEGDMVGKYIREFVRPRAEGTSR